MTRHRDWLDESPFPDLNDLEEDQIKPGNENDVKSNAHMKDDVEEFAVSEFVVHGIPLILLIHYQCF